MTDMQANQLPVQIEISPEGDAIWIPNIKAVLAAIADISMEARGRLFSDALSIMEANSEKAVSEPAFDPDDEQKIITLNLDNPFVRSMFESLHGKQTPEVGQ